MEYSTQSSHKYNATGSRLKRMMMDEPPSDEEESSESESEYEKEESDTDKRTQEQVCHGIKPGQYCIMLTCVTGC